MLLLLQLRGEPGECNNDIGVGPSEHRPYGKLFKTKTGCFRENLEASEREDAEERCLRCLVVFCSLAMMGIY